MRGRVIAALLLVLALCAPQALAQEAALGREEALGVVQALFAAAAGTTLEQEQALRAGADGETILAHTQALAAYREGALPWLMAALAPELTLLDGTQEAPQEIPDGTPDEAPGPLVQSVEKTYAAYRLLADTQTGRAYQQTLQALGAQSEEEALALTRAAAGQWLGEIDHGQLRAINGDYVCWLYGPDTPIDYPVVQGTDNAYYLDHLFSGEPNAAGTLFLDCRNLPDFGDPNTLIYGHHMRNGSMFKAVEAYHDPGVFEARPYLLVCSESALYLLEIFAGYITTSDDPCYEIAISDEADKAAFVDRALRRSEFDAGLTIGALDSFVTLSTCAYRFENARYLAIGRLRLIGDRQEYADEAPGMPGK